MPPKITRTIDLDEVLTWLTMEIGYTNYELSQPKEKRRSSEEWLNGHKVALEYIKATLEGK